MFHPSNRFIIHECLSFYYVELWKNVLSTKSELSSTRALLFYLGLWQCYHPRDRFIIQKSFFSLTWGLWKFFHPQNRFIIYESLFFSSFGLWKFRVKSVWYFRAVIGITVVFLLLPSHRRPSFAPLPSHCVRVSSLPPPLLPAAFPVTFLRHFLAISIIAGQVLISSSC